jgi:hypothetical protein
MRSYLPAQLVRARKRTINKQANDKPGDNIQLKVEPFRPRTNSPIRGNPQLSLGQHHFDRERLKHGARLSENVCIRVLGLDLDADT